MNTLKEDGSGILGTVMRLGKRQIMGLCGASVLVLNLAYAQPTANERVFFEAFELLRAGNAYQAAQKFELGLSREPNDAKAWFYLGEAYRELRDRQKAYDAYKSSIAADSSGPVSSSARQRMAEVAPSPPPIGSVVPSSQSLIDETSSGYKLAQRKKCFACHTVNRKLVGPSFLEVANRYRVAPGALDQLTRKVIEGGSGAWGPVPMPRNPQVQFDESKALVSWILSL